MPQRPQYANIAILCPALQVRAALKGVFWMGTEFMTFCRWAPAGQNNMSVGPGQGNVMPGHDNTEHTLNITKQNNRRCLSDVITSNNGPLRQLGTNVSLSWDWDNCHLMLTANITLHCASVTNYLAGFIHLLQSTSYLIRWRCIYVGLNVILECISTCRTYRRSDGGGSSKICKFMGLIISNFAQSVTRREWGKT